MCAPELIIKEMAVGVGGLDVDTLWPGSSNKFTNHFRVICEYFKAITLYKLLMKLTDYKTNLKMIPNVEI